MATFTIIPRSEWGAKPLRPGTSYSPMTQPDGWVVHYVGGACPQDPSIETSKALVRQLQEDAMNDPVEKYIDIEYSFLIDLNGRIFEGRGWANKSGANGSSNYNGHAWAVCVLMGPGDGKPLDKNHLTQEAKDALSWLTREGARQKPAVSYVKGHRDVYATHCPGDELYAFVPVLNAHLHTPEPAPVPPNTEVEDMLISAPSWQQKHKDRTPTVGLDLVHNRIVSRNGAHFLGGPNKVPVGTEHVIGFFETFHADGSKEGFTVQASRNALGENPDFHYVWPKKP